MRSKEVEDAINDLMFIVVTNIYDNEVRIDKTKVINEYNQSVGTVLDYIKTLEKENLGLLTRLRADSVIDRDNYWRDKIRDKIKELEEERRKIESSPYDKWDLYKVIGKISVLKELLGE